MVVVVAIGGGVFHLQNIVHQIAINNAVQFQGFACDIVADVSIQGVIHLLSFCIIRRYHQGFPGQTVSFFHLLNVLMPLVTAIAIIGCLEIPISIVWNILDFGSG